MKKIKAKILYTSLILTLCISSTNVYALRCGKQIVVEGDSQGKVVAKCGMPTFSSNSYAYRNEFGTVATGSSNEYVNEEVWTYNFGPRSGLYILTFRNNILVDISTDGYGF